MVPKWTSKTIFCENLFWNAMLLKTRFAFLKKFRDEFRDHNPAPENVARVATHTVPGRMVHAKNGAGKWACFSDRLFLRVSLNITT